MTAERAIQAAAAHDAMLRDELLKAFPELGDDDTALIDTLDGISDLDCAIEEVLASAAEDEAFASALAERIAEMRVRRERYIARAERKEAIVLDVMTRCRRHKITRPSVTASVFQSSARAVLITDESLVPAEYKITPPAAASKTLIKAALEANIPVPGATLSNGPPPSLKVKRT